MAKGLLTNSELVDTLIVDLNNLVKEYSNGQYIQACCYITQMSQKLLNLRKSIDSDLKSRDECIEALKRELRAAGREVVDISPELIDNNEKDGAK